MGSYLDTATGRYVDDEETQQELADMQDRDDYKRGMYDDDFDLDFAVPGSNSALRATNNPNGRCGNRSCGKRVQPTWSYCPHCSTALNPRKHPCPNCDRPNLLTDEDVRRHYVCNGCADARERGGWSATEY